jgi:fructose-bisphosphate aldolase class II
MPLVDMKDMLDHAYRHGYAVGGFDLASLDFLEAIVAAAEQTRAPLILSLAESHFEYYDFTLAMAASEAAARRASVPVAIQLDHGASFESAVRSINLGGNGVMVDASHRPFAGNVETTARVTRMAHACGVPVGGELGYVAGVKGEDAEKHAGPLVYTSPDEARRYVQETGIDFLAVSIGTTHGRMRGLPQLDFERLAEINRVAGRPLAIHGGTGLSDEQYRRLIENGVSKINCCTGLADAAGARIRENAARDARAGYTGLVKGVRAAIQAEVERMIRLFGSAGRAEAVLAEARPFDPVEHVILYNVSGAGEAAVESIMARGREVLANIPGVRRVITGWAVTEKPKYRFCWIVEFAHENVIASYRDHPDHVAFANEHFRPVAGDRVSIDFVAIQRPAAGARP